MVRATSEKVGRGACPSCAAPVLFRRSSGGMLTHNCDNCESSGYAVKGGAAYAARMATIAAPEAAPAAQAQAAPAPAAPAAKPAPKGFDLGAL